MLQWVLLSYTIEEKTTTVGSDVTVSTVKLYNRRKNNRGLMVQWVLLSYTIEEKTTWGLMKKKQQGSTVSTVKLYNRRKNNRGLMYSEYC